MKIVAQNFSLIAWPPSISISGRNAHEAFCNFMTVLAPDSSKPCKPRYVFFRQLDVKTRTKLCIASLLI